MKARHPEYWGGKDEDPDTWIHRTERVFDANEWLEDRTKVSRAKVALKGLAKRWATVAGASTNPQDRFRLTENGHGDHTGEQNSHKE